LRNYKFLNQQNQGMLGNAVLHDVYNDLHVNQSFN